jgi:hypothetical protein
MSEYANLKQCAAYVLSSFPVREAGTEIPSKVVADYFFQRNIPPAQCVVGLRHCVAMGWVQLLPDNRIRLLEEGVAFVTLRSDTSSEDGFPQYRQG